VGKANVAVIDTNIIINNPYFDRKFENTNIIIPDVVIEELDKLKKAEGLTGKNARLFTSRLVEIFENDNPKSGAKLDTNKIFVFKNRSKDAVNDNKILSVAKYLTKKLEDRLVVLFTNDANLQIKAKIAEVLTGPLSDETEGSIYEDSHMFISLTDEQANSLARAGKLAVTQFENVLNNQYIVAVNETNASQSLLARYIQSEGVIKLIKQEKNGVMNLKPKNLEQTFALDALLDDEVRLVSLIGSAGTGKTLLALAAALHKVLDDPKSSYDGIILARPTVSMGEELGFLPGSADEKLLPWMQPFFDNIEFLMGGRNKNGAAQQLIDSGIIQMQSLSHIRGRTFTNKYMIFDESQNMDKLSIKTILTRAGQGTKIVLTGDVHQIDTKHLDIENNGLTYATEKFKNEGIAAHINLTKSERSELAELAAKLL